MVKTKIIIAALVPVIVSLVLISVINYVTLFQSLDETAKVEFLRTSNKYAASFERKMNDAMDYLTVVANLLETQVETGATDRAMLQRTVNRIFNDYPRVDGSSIYFEPDRYDNKDAAYSRTLYGTPSSGRISWYYYRENDETRYLPESMENDVEFTLPHYTEVKVANKPIYTDPVTYTINGKTIPMFTISYPIHDNDGMFIGAVTVDLYLADIYTQLHNEKIYTTGYMIIANDREQVISGPYYEDIGKSRHEAGLAYALPEINEATEFFNARSIINGKDTLVTIESIFITQLDSCFYLSVAAPLDEINAGGLRLMLLLVIFNIVIVLVMMVTLYFLIGKISAPFKEITDSIDRIAHGDYHVRLNGKYSGEFAIVKDSVNTMADSIEAYINESTNTLDILKNILNGLDAYIYVTIPETGEILFMNEKMKNLFQVTGEVVGQYCYKVLHRDMNERCSFCPCNRLDTEPDLSVVWELHNQVTNRDYRNTDCYINWHGGVKAHLQHSVDITDIKAALDDKHTAERNALALKHDKEKAEEAAKAKTDFLAKMSHEIRTPMNAVMGMSEIMLRKELPQDIYENALGIKNASANLLSIINDILDFTKIESGMFEITEEPYLFNSLVNDVIGIIRVRLIDKPVKFIVDIDPSIPAALIGDELRIRQALINLLSNAVKYTNKGFISLTISGKIHENTVTLTMKVADSGVGVKEEEIDKLFGDFVQVDTAANKGVEGTGLGLAISRNLCRLMGGDIQVCSEYEKGSIFTITLPQRFENYEPFAVVDETEDKTVLLYETRQFYRDSVMLTLERLGIDCLCVESIPSLFENLETCRYVFVSSFMYGSVNPTLKKLKQPPQMVLMSDITEAFAPKDARILTLPVNPYAVANILNGTYELNITAPSAGANFTAPDAKVLIVDDVAANLKVAEGLLMPYEMRLTLCASGREALKLLEKNRYDLIFMDHMMPEMDGLETTQCIRAMEGTYYKSLPIVALTANAVSGVREMFIQNGMDDFLAKPIETAKLDAILDKWIPKEKRKKITEPVATEEESAFIRTLRGVSELSLEKALAVVGGSFSAYERMIKLSANLLPENIQRLDGLLATDMANYTIEAHGIKGVLNNIGAYQLGEVAYELESSSKHGDMEICVAIHPVFIRRLTEFSNCINTLINEHIPVKALLQGDESLIATVIPALEEAVDFFDNTKALKYLTDLRQCTYRQPIDQILTELTRAFERFDFEQALDIINKLKGEIM